MTNQPLTDKELLALLRRYEMTSPKPWRSDFGSASPFSGNLQGVYLRLVDGAGRHIATFWEHEPHGETDDCRNSDFVVLVHSLLPTLLQEVNRLKAEVSLLRNRLEGNR